MRGQVVRCDAKGDKRRQGFKTEGMPNTHERPRKIMTKKYLSDF